MPDYHDDSDTDSQPQSQTQSQSQSQTPTMETIHPGGFADLPEEPEDYIHHLEDRYPAFAAAARALHYLRNPANGPAIARRERRRMRLFLPPLRDTIEADYKAAFWAAYNDDNATFQRIAAATSNNLVFVM
jgi:hypothetical protein